MKPVELFLVHAIELEREAARRYEELSAAMHTEGNAELKVFFTRMAHFSRMHLADARARGGFHELPPMRAQDYQWPDGTAPETAGWEGVDAFLDGTGALELALHSERRGHSYYATIASTSQDPQVRRMAAEFAAEEAQHVAELEKMLTPRLAR
jgi:rubrerythrin